MVDLNLVKLMKLGGQQSLTRWSRNVGLYLSVTMSVMSKNDLG